MAEQLGIFQQKLSAEQFAKLKNFIESECGIRMTEDKKNMAEGRIRKRIKLLGLNSYNDYFNLVFKDGDEAEKICLIDAITTNKTDFFREDSHFQILSEKAVPEILREKGREDIKIWSAGCSTGEEPYTIGIVMSETLGKMSGFKIMATDINTEVLRHAKQGVYDEGRIEKVPYNIKKKYFLRSKDRLAKKVKIVKPLREKLSFARLNFMDDEYCIKERFDIIFCRNVIIYFDRKTQERILNRLLGHLNMGGLLFLGHSETIHGMTLPVSVYAPTVYQKVR